MKKVVQTKAKKPARAKNAKPARTKTVRPALTKKSGTLRLVGAKKAAQKKSSAKAKASPAKKPKAIKAQANGTNVIWKFLQMKEARRREHKEVDHHVHPAQEAANSQKNNVRHHQLSRFAGPRRRSSSSQ